MSGLWMASWNTREHTGSFSIASDALRKNYLGVRTVVGLSFRNTSLYSSEKSKSIAEKIRDFWMTLEVVGDFEDPKEFLKKVNTDELKQGDIIQYKWKGLFHWALYIGDGKIIHVQKTENGGNILMDKINYSDDKSYRCRVNNLKNYAKAKGFQEKPIARVMSDAWNDLAIEDFDYNLRNNNCGHMVTLWKYGVMFNPEVSKNNNVTILGHSTVEDR